MFYMRSLSLVSDRAESAVSHAVASLVSDRAESAEHRVEVTFALSGCPKLPVGCSCKDLGLPGPILCLVSEVNPAASRYHPLGTKQV